MQRKYRSYTAPKKINVLFIWIAVHAFGKTSSTCMMLIVRRVSRVSRVSHVAKGDLICLPVYPLPHSQEVLTNLWPN